MMHKKQYHDPDNMIRNQNSSHTSFLDNDRQLASLPSSILQWIDMNMNGIITVLNSEGEIIYVSKTVEKLLGFQPDELLGIKGYDLISAEDKDFICNKFERIFDENQFFQFYLKTSSGQFIRSRSLATMTQDNDGNVYYAFIINDNLNKEDFENLVMQTEKMSILSQLTAGAVHEIRNPLTSLKGFIQLMQAGVQNEEEFYQVMIDEIEKMEKLTTELMNISKPMTNHHERLDISNMINDVVILLTPQADSKDILIQQNQATNQIVEGDRSKLKQTFTNLLKNAIEAMENSGTINVESFTNQNNVMIDIIDEGPGISGDIMASIEDPFFTTKENGTGLGLMMTRQILEQHAGQMDILQNQNYGTTFRITLPRADSTYK